MSLIHPAFGPVPTYASAEKQVPEGWPLLRVFDGETELNNVVEVDVTGGWYRFVATDHRGRPIVDRDDFRIDRRESGKLHLEWNE